MLGKANNDADNDMVVKNIRTGYLNITAVSGGLPLDQASKALAGLVINAKVIEGTSKINSTAISKFIATGNEISVVLFGRNSYLKGTSAALDRASMVAKNKQLTAIPFCPINNGNVISLKVLIKSISTPAGGAIISFGADRLKTLASLVDAELTVMFGKIEGMQAMQVEAMMAGGMKESDGMVATEDPYMMMVAMGNSNAM